MANVQAVLDLSEDLYLSLSSVGLTRDKLAQESRKLLALEFFLETRCSPSPLKRPERLTDYSSHL